MTRTQQLNACADFLANVPERMASMALHDDRRESLATIGQTLNRLAGGFIALSDAMRLASIAAETLPPDQSGMLAAMWRQSGLHDLADGLEAIRADANDDQYKHHTELAENRKVTARRRAMAI
jgi:hypothetical protein